MPVENETFTELTADELTAAKDAAVALGLKPVVTDILNRDGSASERRFSGKWARVPL